MFDDISTQALITMRTNIVTGLALEEIEKELARRGPGGPVTIRQMADAHGLKTYDTSLPQQWFDDVREKTGQTPFDFVWSYDEASIWGAPFPLTPDAKALLAKYEAATR